MVNNSTNINKKKRTITSYLNSLNLWLGNSGLGLGQAHNCGGLNQIMESQLATGQWFSPGPPVSSNNKTDSHDIAEILLKVALNTIKQTNKPLMIFLIRQTQSLDLLPSITFYKDTVMIRKSSNSNAY